MRFFLTITIFAGLFLLSSCSKTPEEMIVGTWKVTNFESTNPDYTPEQLEETKKDQVENLTYEFKAKDELTMTYGEDVSTWSWAFKNENKQLLIKAEDNSLKYEIVELSGAEAKELAHAYA